MEVDLPKIIADIKFTAQRIAPLKRALRCTWSEPMGDVQRRLVRLKRRATELCVLRAFLRGRIHLRTRPAGWVGDWNAAEAAARIAERVSLEYAPKRLERTARLEVPR